MVSEQALPKAPKSAASMDGAMMAGGDMARGSAVGAGNVCRCRGMQLLAPMAEGAGGEMEVDLPRCP
jgi:hypothetical protein